MMQFEYKEGVPDTNRYVLILDEHYFGPVWYPAKWEDSRWQAYEFENDDEIKLEPSCWMEMDFDILKANKFEDGPPSNDRYILILAEDHFGMRIWHPAAWLGEDDGPAGEYCWTLNGLGYTQHELGVTHWMEMPPTEEEDEDVKTGFDLWS